MSKKAVDPKKRKFYFRLVRIIFFILFATYLLMVVSIFIFKRLKYLIIETTFEWDAPLVLSIFVVGGLLFGLLVTMVMAKIFLKPINQLSDATKQVAKGDFSVELENPDEDTELGELIANFNKMVRDLRKVETLKNDFIANVSHEFKTPLSTIQGYSTLLQDENLSAEERAAYTNYIIEATKQLSNLTGNILKLSKLENGEVSVEKNVFDCAEQIRQAILFLETQWSIKNMELDIDLATAEMYLNEELLMQVWLNLLGNAIKFSDYAGKLVISSVAERDIYTVTIKDFGCGMSEQTLERVFEKFYQGDNSHSKDGNGLGLALVKKILDISGGEISVQSEEGKGTTFTVRLPLKQLPAKV